MTNPSDDAPVLPGLEEPPSTRPVTELEEAVRRTIAAHAELEHLTPIDAGKCAIAIELCQVAAAKRAGRRLSTVSNDLRLLTEILDSLTPTADADANQRLVAAMAEWEEAMKHDGAPGHPGSEVRDTA